MDERLKWLESRISSSLRPRNEDLKAMLASDENRLAFHEFIKNEDSKSLFVYVIPPRKILASLKPPFGLQTKSIFFMKSQGAKLTRENIGEEVAYTDVDPSILDDLDAITREVFLPLLCADDNHLKDGVVSSDRLMDQLHRVTASAEVSSGHIKGEVILPLPSVEVLAEAAADPSRRPAVLHVLESTVIGWMKQIRGLLKHEPIEDLERIYGKHPGPLDELALWTKRQAMLQSIEQQLESPIAKDIILNLEEAQSQYANSFTIIRKDIQRAMRDTAEILQFWDTMKPWFVQFHEATVPAQQLRLLPPIVHTIMLVWQYSRYYHQPSNFYTLLRVISNEVVHRAKAVVGENIMTDPSESYTKLKDALKVCAAFRGTYLDYRDKSDAINDGNIKQHSDKMTHNAKGDQIFSTRLYGPYAFQPKYGLTPEQEQGSVENLATDRDLFGNSAWPPRNASCFNLLNSFMERCNDVLELVQTTRHFRLLADAANVGGAGNQSLDAVVNEIHGRYKVAMEHFYSSVNNVLAIDGTQSFEKAFFNFRTVVKSLEVQLASIIRQSFTQCPTVGAQLRLLEVFEGISSRELVQSNLKDKDQLLVQSFYNELMQVKTMFNYLAKSPPHHKNMPSVVSKMQWIHSMRQRVQLPMEKMKQISPQLLEGDRGWQLRDLYAELLSEFDKFESRVVDRWQEKIATELTAKLKQPVLVAADYDEDTELRPQVLHVNLDPKLLLLLREIHYLTQSPYNIPVPPAARDLIRNTDPYTLRVLATRLETITSKYNTVMKLIGDYERPLFERKLARIDQLLDKGLNLLTWRSKDLNDFIESASQLVCTDVYVNLDTVQSNCKDIADTALAWCKGVLDVFATRDGTISYPMHQLVRLQKDIESHIELDLVPAGTRIHQLVESSFNAVGISKASPAWEDYTDFMDAIVLNGLKQTTLASLKSMWYQMSEATLMNGAVPILTIRLELIQGRVTFKPPLEESTSITSVQEVVLSWIDLYKCRGRYVHMLGPKGEYKEYIDADEDVSSTCDEIMKLVQHNSKQCIGLLELFTEYSFLWEQDVKETFSDFLRGTVPPNPRRSTVNTKEGPGKMRQDAQSASSSRPRSSSAKSMESVGLVGTAEKSFLATEAAGTQEEETIPSLDEFDAEIDIYKSSRDEILELQSHCDIGWVRVDLEPVKQVLITYASKWMWTFTSYLADKVTELLHNLDSFLKRIEPEIESIRGNERDTASFMKMMRLFNEVTAQQQEMDVKFAAMHRTVLLLKKYDQALPIETQNLFTAAPSRWNNLKTKVSLAKQRLGPRIQEESERITKDLAAFGKRILKLEEKLDESEVYSYECSMGNAWTTLDSFHRQLAELENEAQDLQELQDLLETDVVNFEILPKSRLNIENLKQVWEAVRVLGEEQNDWRCHRWHKINTKQLRQETDRQIAFIARLPDETFLWDVYMGLHSSIDNIQACLPLIDDLSNPAMRTRHWKQLVRVTGGAVQIDNDTLKRMTLGELLSLGLQTHVDDVRAIVQRAVKDLAIEKALKTYEEVWLSKLFELRSHVRSRQAEQPDNINDNQSEISHTESHASHRPTTHTRSGSRVSGQSSLSKLRRGSASSLPASLLNLPEDTGVLMLLTNTEPIFDELESHQVALQTMQSSSAAGSFMDEVMKWQKRLQTIEAVVSLWLEVQDRWAELEEIYSTAEIRTSLAKDAQLFDEINRDFCLLMRASERNPNILQCCSRKNILAILERMKAALAHCYKALLHQLSRRLQKFPRFYFLSLEDVLHIVCNGYDLRQVNGYIGKLFENIGELTFNDPDDTEKNVYEITGVKSALNEQLTFNQPTTCEGQIETWLPSFLQNITSSLQNQLAVILGAESDGGKKKSIRSAGSRKIIISSQGSRPNSKQQKGEKTPSRGGKRPSGQQPIEKPSETLNEEEGKSWTLDNVTEVVYLVTQLQMTGQIGEACEALEGGDKNAIQNAIIKVTSSIQESVLMLKGFETKHERLEMSRSSSRRAASAASVSGRDKKDESNSHSTSAAPTAEKQRAGGSKQGSRAAGSVRGSMFDLAIEPQKTPIPEEDGSLGPDDHNQPSSADEAHVNTMDLGDTFNKLINKPESEEEEVEIVDQTEIRLMLFPSQIHKISSIIALLAFYRDLLQRLEALAADEKEKKISEAYLWKSQLQYNFDAATKAVNVQCLDMSIEYDFEYQGSAPREVISPVTERVFVNLCMAVKSHTNVIVSGPTGSGRLETVHELTRQLGRPFYWFNCHRSYNHVLLHNVVKGMALTGAWVCLNNMNYLPPALLSELAQLLGTVMSALKQGKTTTSLGQEELQIHSKGACMGITNSLIKVQSTDPESEPIFPSIIATLPNDLLKQFRQVSILKPNLLLTVEALLLGQGFTNAAELAKKMLQLQELCVNLGGVDHTFRDTATIGTDVSKGGWSLQTLKHIIIHSGTVLDKVTSESLTAQYETIHEVPEGDGETLLPEGEQTQRENQESGAPNTEKLNQNDDTDNAKTDGDAIEKADDPKPTDSEKPPTITDDRLKPEKLLADEEFSLVSSLRDTFLPRLGTRDRFVFTSLVSDIWPNAEVALDFAGSQKELAAEAQSQGRLSTKPPSRPFSRTTSTTQAKNKQSKTYIPGIKESLNLNTPVVTIAADFKHETDTKQPEALDDTSDAIAVATANLGLLPGVAFQARVAQLSHLNTAHKAILVVGPPGCGKSECIKTFAVAERERGKSLSIQSVFTKAFEPEAFLGYFDNNNEWHDGLLPHILRKYCSKLPQSTALLPENKSTVKVVLLDGECDPTQMEIMDSILHNDGTIVLGNNERIPMSGHVRFIWESESLKNVTPAILANVGLLVMSRDDLGWQMMLTQWLNHRDDESKILLGDLCEVYVPKLVKFLAEATSPPLAGRKGKDIPTFSRCIRQSEENMVTTFCNLFEAMTSTVMEEVSEEAYERYFVFSLIWSFAGTLEYEDRDAFSVWWRQTFEQRLTWPFSGTIFDYTIDPDSKEFTGWSNVIPSYTGTAHAGIPNDAFVHTISNGQLYYLLSQLSDVGKPVMLIGPPGCGKSSIIKERIRNVSTGEVAEVLALTINANRFTTSNLLYERLNEKLEWKHGRTFVPRGSKRLICLIDDLNLSHVDDQGYQSAVELIRQHLDEGGFYSAENLRWRYVRNVTYVSAINPKQTTTPLLSSRLLRHFAMFNCAMPCAKELQRIYRTLLHTHFITPEMQSSASISASAAQHLGIKEEKVKTVMRSEEEALRNLLTLIVTVTIQLQEKLGGMFLCTAQRCHYSFTMKHLAVIFRNLTLSLQQSSTTQNVLWLWQHECDYVYGSRMVNSFDRNRYETAFNTAVRKDFTSDDEIKQLSSKDKPIFSNLIEQDSGIITAGKVVTVTHQDVYRCDDYKPTWDEKTVKGLLTDAIEEYNKIYPMITIPLHTYTIQQICRLARVISSPYEVAHLHLISEGYPGTTSTMVKLAAHLSDFCTVQINASLNVMNNHNKMDLFKGELVHAYTRAGVKHERTLFLLQDDELFDENFLVFISEFVISGDITHLFTHEEMTTIINSIRTDVTQAGLTYTKEVAWNFFLNTVRNNFRVCFISTDGSAAFQQRCRSFPSLISSLNYIWLPNWSRGTLVKHAHYHLAEVGWMDKTQKENIAHMLGSMHLVIRQADGKEETCGTYNSLTNTTYERFVESYVKLAKRRYDEIIAQHEAITKSLDQIYQENELAAKLHRQLEHEKIVLEERILGTTKILAQIGQDTAITEQQVKIVKQQLEKIKRLKKLLPEYQVAHERAVFKASALAIDTKKIVTNMSMESLQELRAMQKPIIEVEDLMAAVIMILKSPTADLTWQKGAKRQMANLERFIEEMSTFDDQQMAESTLVLVEPYLKKASFKPDTLEKKSANVACGALCKWVHGVVKYHRMMISKVKPLHDKVVSTTSAVDNAEHKMATLDSKRKALEVRLRDLGKGFEDATIDKNDQEEKTIKMDKMLNTAADLREAIQNETARAEQVHKSLKARLACVDGGVAIAAAFSTYLGPYSHNFRKLMLTVQWPYCLRERGIPLVIDTVDHIRGRVIDFAIEGLVPDMDEYDEALPVSARGSQKRGSDRAPTDEDLDSLPDDYDEEEDYEEESDDDVEPELTNDNPAELPEADESTAREPESSPPTRQKDGQPLEPLHEVHEEEQKTEGPQSVKNNNEGRTPTAIDELISVDGVVSKTQYKAYISSIVRLLVGEQLQLKWVKKDMDTRQLENAAILASSWQRPALLIDPYEEGKQFLMDFSKSVFKMTMISIEDNCMESSGVVALEKAITQGKPALVSGINDRINNMLVPLIHHYCTLNEDHITNGKSKMINYCGRRLLCHPQHQLFLSTSNPRAILNPVIASMTTMISYSTDADALTDKLVKRAFARVRPELYKEKLLVLRNIHTLKELMNRVIEYTKRDLIHSTGNKVWNEQDVKIIAEGMQIKQQVSKKLNENIETLNKLQALQDELLPVAKRASLLYSLLRSLSVLSKHYQFRLPQFLQIFYEAVGEDPSADVFIEEEEEEDDEEGTAVPSLRTTREPTRVISGKSGSPKNTQTNQVTEGDSDYGDDFERGESGEKEDSMEDKTNEMTSIHDITPYMQLLGNIPEFPTEGIAYTELQANQSTLLVEILTTNVLKYARMSLDGDDLLLFNAIACLTIQKETEHPFTDEELSLLTQGNPGLGMQLSLEDFGSEAKPPEWLARDKWESVMAVSVLPGALDNICVQVAEDADAWKKWYEHENPETIKLPTKPQTDRSKQGETREPQAENTETKKVEQATDGEEPGPSVENAEAGTDAGETVMGEKTTVDGTVTDENDLSEMHRLLIIRLLRPDRLMYALREYVERHMPAEQSGPVSFEAMRSYIGSHNLAAMITLPTSYTCQLSMQKIDTDFVGLFSFVADARSVAFKHVTICDGCGPQLDSILESASKSESETWLLIDKLHLAPENLMMEITTKLQRAVRTKILPTVHGWNYIAVDEEATGGQLMIWITTEMTDSIPLALLDLTVSLSWHLMTREFFEAGQPLVGSIPVCCTQHALTRSVVMCLRACDDDTWEKLGAELPSIKVMSFSVALALGLLMARQMYGAVCSSQWYAWSKQHITECMQVLLSQSFSNHDELSMLEGKITFLVHDVFGRFVNSEADRSLIMRLADFVIRSVVFNQVGILYLANHEIPLPPPNVEPIGYAAWFEDTLQKLEPTDVNTLLLHPALLKIHNQSRSISVLEKLEKVSEAQTTDSIEINAIPPPTHINVSQLNMVCSSCLEQLPPLIEVAGMTAVGRSGSYNFPYKPPSAYSDISTDSKSGLLPESIGYILLEECYHMNALLCHVRQSLYDITESIIAGQDGIAAQYMSSARALVKEQVPVSWLHSNLQPSTHNLFSWLDDLQRRYTQIRSWNKSGLVPKPDKQTKQAVLSQDYLFHGKLRMVWLGGLFNPHGLLTALRHEKAVLSNVPFDKISLVCEPAGLDVSEGDLLVEGMFLQAAAWDEECGCLTKSSKLINTMPTVLLKAVVDGAENEGDKEKSETKTSKADEPDSQEKEDKKYGIYYCPIFTTKNRQVLIDYLPMKSLEADCVHWQLTCTCLILDGGLSELYPRHHQLIQPARVDELELAPSEPDSAYQTRLGTAESRSGMRSRPRPNGTGLTNGTPQRRVTSKPPSPESQLSYKRMSPKAQPLPPDLAMTRDAGRGRLGQSQEGNTKANSKAASRHASRQSVFKSILMDEYGSNKAASTTGSDTKSQGGESHVGSVRGTPAHGSPARQPTASLRGSKEGSVTGSKPSSKPASKRVSPALSKRTSPAASKHPTPIPNTSKQPSPAPSNKSATKVSPTGGSRVSPAGSASSQKQSKPASTRSTPHQSPL